MKKTLIGALAATAVVVPLALAAAPANAAPIKTAAASATAATTVKYAGQVFTNGVLNTDLGGETGYILWVFNANGATSATINLPDGQHTMAKSGNGFKFSSKYWALSALGDVTVDYTGSAKNTVLTVSHGHAVDTNIPENSFDSTTGTGDIPRGDLPADATFNVELTNTTATRWSASGQEYSRSSVVTQLWSVKATPIIGDVTLEVVGWHLDGGDTYIKYVSGGYTGAPYVGYTDPGTVFEGFLPNVFTASYNNLQLEDGTLV